jgi:hypothetical protein
MALCATDFPEIAVNLKQVLAACQEMKAIHVLGDKCKIGNKALKLN